MDDMPPSLGIRGGDAVGLTLHDLRMGHEEGVTVFLGGTGDGISQGGPSRAVGGAQPQGRHRALPWDRKGSVSLGIWCDDFEFIDSDKIPFE